MKRRQLWSWALYDWANSAFMTTVMAGFFPIFFQQYWSAGGVPAVTTARLGLANSISALIVAFLSPMLGSIADARAWRKGMLFVFTAVGVVFTGLLAVVGKGEWAMAAFVFGMASLGINTACAFYDSLLPSVAPAEKLHHVSALGYSLGYLGGGLLFAVNVAMYLKPALFGLADGVSAVKWSFVSVAVWWAVFSLPIFLFCREEPVASELKGRSLVGAVKGGFSEIRHAMSSGVKTRGMGLFLLAYWIYIDGVLTVIKMAVDFGVSIGLPASNLIAALLLVQFVGFPSAILFGWLGTRWDARKAVLLGLGVYGVVVIWGYSMHATWEFFTIAVLIGMVQGGVQSLSRSIFAQLVPPEKSGEFFGLFNLVGRFAAVIGPALMGITALISPNPRTSILSLLLLFGVGGALLFKVRGLGAPALSHEVADGVLGKEF